MRRLVFIAHSCQNLSNPFIYKAFGVYIKGDTKRHLVLAPILRLGAYDESDCKGTNNFAELQMF